MFSEQDNHYMQRALELAALAADNGEVPVGAVLVINSEQGSEIIAEAGNQLISANDPTAHAEILALRAGADALNNYRLNNTTLYVTLEPCAMCAGALVHARVERLVFAASDPKAGACGSVFEVLSSNDKMHRVNVESGLMAEEASKQLTDFFKMRRAQNKLERHR